MLGWIREKMVIQDLTPGGCRFSTSGSTIVDAVPHLVATHALEARTIQLINQEAGAFSPHNVECKKGEG
jgi:hypothetical protein